MEEAMKEEGESNFSVGSISCCIFIGWSEVVC